ncbi:MAG: S8 family serine peptidase, partial [Bacteroidia bacterium]|nr:S8 family serine peptidase [Bacteroidia bacterium]
MKKLILIIAITSFCFSASNAQNISKISYKLLKLSQNENWINKSIPLLVMGDVNNVRAATNDLEGTFKYSVGDISSIDLPVKNINEFLKTEGLKRIEGNEYPLEMMNERMLINNNLVAVHLGFSPLSQPYDGKDVVMGVIDSGIDFNHPDFKDINGNSRIKYIWDHNLNTGNNPPFPYNYGEQFTDSMINNNQANAHYDRVNGHGTHVTGIAAGNGLAVNNYIGAAPACDIIAVSVNFGIPSYNTWLSSVADAVSYIYEKADEMGKPCVINISAGTYYGSHDGRDLQAQLIDNLISQKNGRSLVCAAGNAGAAPIHLQHQLNSSMQFTWFKNASGNYTIEVWGDSTDIVGIDFAIGCDQVGNKYQLRGMSSFTNVNDHLTSIAYDTVMNGSNSLGTIERFSEYLNGTYKMSFNIDADSTQYNWRLVSQGTGTFDSWSFEMVTNNLPSQSIFPDIAFYKLPDISQNIVSSFTCSDKVITVGEYANRNFYTDVNGNVVTTSRTVGEIVETSSHGPTRDGRIKPDISSTGSVTLSAATLASIPWFMANEPFKLAAGGMHFRDGGTSSASPAVAGAVALYLQQFPNADHQQIKAALINCAKRDQFTGTNLPDNTWGNGKLDAFSFVTNCGLVS